MNSYSISNKISGSFLGIYVAESEADALDAMARDAGYADYAEVLDTTDGTHGDLLIEENVRRVEITTIMNFAERACEGMSDYQNVGADEDAATAASEIVAYWEEETGLLTGRDLDHWNEIGATSADLDELRGRCVARIQSAIERMRAR